MRVVNNLTKPGDIRRVDLNPDTVRIQTHDGQDRIYKLADTIGCTQPRYFTEERK